MTSYDVWDDSGTHVTYLGSSAQEVAESYEIDCEWGDDVGPFLLSLRVQEECDCSQGEGEEGDEHSKSCPWADGEPMIEFVDVPSGNAQEEPDCSDGDHAWRSPEWLGGCRENPGVDGLV